MVFPIIPVTALIAVLGGGFLLGWYQALSKGEQEKMDEEACDLASKLFRLPLDQLNRKQAERVLDELRERFGD